MHVDASPASSRRHRARYRARQHPRLALRRAAEPESPPSRAHQRRHATTRLVKELRQESDEERGYPGLDQEIFLDAMSLALATAAPMRDAAAGCDLVGDHARVDADHAVVERLAQPPGARRRGGKNRPRGRTRYRWTQSRHPAIRSPACWLAKHTRETTGWQGRPSPLPPAGAAIASRPERWSRKSWPCKVA